MKQSSLAIAVIAMVVAVVACQFTGRGSSTPGQQDAFSRTSASAGVPGASAPGRPWTGPGSPLAASPLPAGSALHFPGGLLIADRGNGRLLVVDNAGHILWHFPRRHGSLPAGETFSADDAFIAPDGKTIVANEEGNQVVVRIDIATRKVIWEYGHYRHPGPGHGHLWNPDDAYPLANGDITVADIKNCRIIEIAPDKHIVKQWGRTGVCSDHPPRTYGYPNGDTPLPDGGMLVTEIHGARVVRLSAAGRVLFDIHVPLSYPSDAQLLPNGNVLVVDYSTPGKLIVINPMTRHIVYRYGPKRGPGMLDHPSLALPLPDGTFVLNDDFRHRVVVIDPTTNRIIWTYGHNRHPGAANGYLDTPDGVDVAPVGIFR